MKLSTTPQNINNLTTLPALLRILAPWITQISDAINNPQLTITDNIALQIVTVQFPGSGQSVTAAHKLGKTPQGYIIVKASAAISVYDGNGASNGQQISLQASAAGKVSLILF